MRAHSASGGETLFLRETVTLNMREGLVCMWVFL